MPDHIHKNKQDTQPDLFDDTYPGTKDNRSLVYAVMHCDGACSGNPGKSGIGVVIDLAAKEHPSEGETETYHISEYIGIATNNIAEYSAFIEGLKKARSLGVKHIRVFVDSELLVRQINGIYKVKNKNLLPLWTEANNVLKEFDYYNVTHVRRELNSEADRLARQAVINSDG